MLKNKNIFMKVMIAAFIIAISFACQKSKQTVTERTSTKQTSQESPTSFGNRVKIKTPDDKEAADIQFDGGGVRIAFNGKTIHSESKNQEKRKYYNDSRQIAEVKMKDDDGFKVRTTDGQLLWKIKISNEKIKISDNEENLNAFELKKREDGIKIEQNEAKIGEVKFYPERQKIKVKDSAEKEIYDANTDKYSAAYGVLLLEKIPEELRYIIAAELLLRQI